MRRIRIEKPNICLFIHENNYNELVITLQTNQKEMSIFLTKQEAQVMVEEVQNILEDL